MSERLRRHRPALTAFALALVWTGWVYAAYFRGANSFEFGEYAEIGRNILHGHGFTTRILYPSMLATLDAAGLAGLEYTPINHRFPLPAYLSALSQAVLGSGDFASVAPTLLLFSAWVALVFAAATRWLGRPEAVLAAAMFAAVPAGVKYFMLFNLPDVPFGALLFALHWGLADTDARADARRLGTLGALGGLLYLCRYNFWIWIPLYALFLARTLEPARRARGLSAFLGAYAAVCAPALWYKSQWFTSAQTLDVAWNLAHGTVLAEQPWLEFRTFDAADILRSAWPAIAAKAIDRLHTTMLEAPMLWQCQALVPFVALGALRWPAGPARRFAALSLAALAVQLAAFAPLRFDSWGLGVGYRYLFWFCPVLVLAGVRGAKALADAAPERLRIPALAAWAALHAAFTVPFYTHDLTAIHVKHPSGRAPREWPEITWVRQRAHVGAGVVSNIPAQIGWYADAPAVSLPNDPEDVPRMAKVRPLRYLVISTLNIGTLGDLPRWLDLLRPDLAGLKSYCAKHGYRIVDVIPGAVLVDLGPRP